MSLRIARAAIAAENADQLHEARLLLLLHHATEKGDGSIDGITKLAKLDFLLRYPKVLQRLLDKLNADRKKKIALPIASYEQDTVESKMIRFRYGPWDPRYRRWIGVLVAKGLADTYLQGRTVHVKLTDRGQHTAIQLSDNEDMKDLDLRARVLSTSVGSKSGQWLKDTIYEIVPELTGMPWGKEIET